MGDPCAACKHAFDSQGCPGCDDFADWTPCRQLAPIVERIRAEERENCAKICESSAKRYEELAIAARESRGPLSNSEANEYLWAAECARQQAKQIRGER